MARHRGGAWAPALIAHWGGACRTVLRDTAAFFAPVACAGCGVTGVSVCAGCAAAREHSILTRVIDGVPVYSAAPYADKVKRMLLALKRDGRVDVAETLGRALRRALGAALADAHGAQIDLVAVPASGGSRRRRGFVPVALIVSRAGFSTTRALRWARRPRDQIGLGRVERDRNLSNAITASRASGRRFIVIDDVVTSGATLSECLRALTDAGAEVVACATVASTLRRVGEAGEIRSVTSNAGGATVYEKA